MTWYMVVRMCVEYRYQRQVDTCRGVHGRIKNQKETLNKYNQLTMA